MTKDIKFMVERANYELATGYLQNHKEAREELVEFIGRILLMRNMYYGFNYYKEVDGNLVLAGKETTLIQFYTH